MPRLTPVSWQVLECIFEKDDFVFERQKGSHRCYSKDGCLRPVVIPVYNEIDPRVISDLLKTAGMTRKRYFELLRECKSRS